MRIKQLCWAVLAFWARSQFERVERGERDINRAKISKNWASRLSENAAELGALDD